MPVYPGTRPPLLGTASCYEKDGYRETLLEMYSHTGTHMDAPAHLFDGRTTLDAFPPEQFAGKALVIDCRDMEDGQSITMSRINCYREKADAADFLLFNLGWDRYWGRDSYFGDYPCIDSDVLDYILQGDYKGIGFDVIGLDPISDVNLTRHKKLFESKDIVNIENLKNLELCGNDLFTFVCLPLKFENSDGAPVRAIAVLED